MTAISYSHHMPFGAEVQADGQIRFRLWAPAAPSIQLQLEGHPSPLAMERSGEGWHQLVTRDARVGSRYQFVLPDGSRVPDPASRHQADDIHGPTEVIDPAAFAWSASESPWPGRPWAEAVLYELHVGTFTPEGTFLAAIGKLDHLAELGVTAIELMSIGDFPGCRGWGYDSVLIYAPAAPYGRPEHLKQLVDAAHARGLMVILDVVYNHFGPEGNYLPRYFPQICTDRYNTPWGPALNFDGEGSQQTRELIIHNALYWIEEFQIDGLRLDAAHELIDNSPRHILDELADRVHAATPGRFVHLILEHDRNVTDRLIQDCAPPAGCYSAQWNHDMGHLLRPAFASKAEACQQADPSETEKLGKALTEGYVISAEMRHIADPEHVPPPTPVAPIDFVSYIQNHDLVGNRIAGDRIHSSAAPAVIRALSAVHLLLPQIPMLFMGQEWDASTPFPYFCDFHGDLAEAVRKGRCDFIKALHDVDPSQFDHAPDPQSAQTFRSAKLNWDELSSEPHSSTLDRYKRLLAVRREEIIPRLGRIGSAASSWQRLGPEAGIARWCIEGREELVLAFNLCHNALEGFTPPPGRVLWHEGPPATDGKLHPWSVIWTIKDQDPKPHI